MATGQTHGGKGSSTRPTDKKKYEDNYDAIFGKKNKDKKMPDSLKNAEYPVQCTLKCTIGNPNA